MKSLWKALLLEKLLKMVDNKSNLLGLLLKEMDVGSNVPMQLVEGSMDLGEFITDVGGIRGSKEG